MVAAQGTAITSCRMQIILRRKNETSNKHISNFLRTRYLHILSPVSHFVTPPSAKKPHYSPSIATPPHCTARARHLLTRTPQQEKLNMNRRTICTGICSTFADFCHAADCRVRYANTFCMDGIFFYKFHHVLYINNSIKKRATLIKL